jgi:hypothetical protein
MMQQIERMKHFDFDEWRQRYMRWMNHNKSRIMDFFRKQDRDHDGRITRQEFIDGILQSSMFLTFTIDTPCAILLAFIQVVSELLW